MKYKTCPDCGFANEVIDPACKRCGRDITSVKAYSAEEMRQLSAQQAAAPHRGAEAASGPAPASASALNYPYAEMYVRTIRRYAKLVAWLIAIAGALAALVILGVGISGLGYLKGFQKVGGLLGTFFTAGLVVGWHVLVAYLTFVLLMASADFMECQLQIESNTRRTAELLDRSDG
jgi:hypothetical protein